ncbi:MAG: hypothetical protein J6Q00_01040 [Verrucomicrobia bacterium]|nr:hypothetical protein [Verrucomicrobiota bacterium]
MTDSQVIWKYFSKKLLDACALEGLNNCVGRGNPKKLKTKAMKKQITIKASGLSAIFF